MVDGALFGLSLDTVNKLNRVFIQHPAINLVVLYGSRAKGNYRLGSDIDLVIKGSEIPFAEFLQIENQIDDLMLPYTVDLSQFCLIDNPDLIGHINRVGVEFFSTIIKGV